MKPSSLMSRFTIACTFNKSCKGNFWRCHIERALHCYRCEHSYTCLGTFGQSRMVLAIQWSGTVLDERSQVVQGWIQEKFVVCSW